MPRRRTKRGAARTPLAGDWDVIVSGASFAGLAVARELAGTGARVLMLDRYEIGERQTSACGIPTAWLEVMGLMGSHRQAFGELVVHTPHATARFRLPWTFSTFDYPELCRLLREQTDCAFETAKVDGRRGQTLLTDRGELRAPLVVDAMGWRRILAADGGYQPPDVGSEAVRYQGNWIPHKLRSATEDGVFFVGDSAGHCLPLTAEGIRTAFYFGIACGRELRRVLEGRQTREQALRRYHDFSAAHEPKFRWMLRAQRLGPRVPPRLLARGLLAMQWRRFVDWSFRHYLRIAPPSFALAEPPRGRRPLARIAAASPE